MCVCVYVKVQKANHRPSACSGTPNNIILMQKAEPLRCLAFENYGEVD